MYERGRQGAPSPVSPACHLPRDIPRFREKLCLTLNAGLVPSRCSECERPSSGALGKGTAPSWGPERRGPRGRPLCMQETAVEGLASCLSGGWKGLMDAVVFERLKAVVLSPTLLVSEVTVPPDVGLKACARSRPPPAPCPLAIVCMAQGWGQAAGTVGTD